MLHEFLKAIRDGEVQSLLEISRILSISLDMVLRMARDLTRRGYLQEMCVDCDTLQAGCSDCPVGSNCQVPTRHWFLTEKGKAAVSRMGQEKANQEVTHGVISSP